ncbi:MAG: GH36 C-terminal domain-containing protein, partial [Treponema sp.]|nr:GH36 C-terminal domain-containing protein [Treponema sp.]
SHRVIAKGLNPNMRYRITIEDSLGKTSDEGIWTGLTLMNAGFLSPRLWGDFNSQLIHIVSE